MEVARSLGSTMTATESCITAIFIASSFVDDEFEELIHFGRRCGGDVDTILAMAGAMWGAANGAARIPSNLTNELEQLERIEAIAGGLYDFAQKTIAAQKTA